ncbi:MAG: hypothetical protein M1831_000081 [Alyxoria varia]|nr:MAG: hypothetical protein M1831_000081 [Alyxoria varia]
MAEKQQGEASFNGVEVPFGGFLNKLSYLSESQKNRLLCGYLFSEGGKVNYKAAASAYGTTSVHSMSVHFGKDLKQLKEADASAHATGAALKTKKATITKGAASSPAKNGGNADDEEATPGKQNSGVGKKRSSVVKEEGHSDDEEGATTPKKSTGRGKKRKISPADENAMNDNEGKINDGFNDMAKITPMRKASKKNGTQKSPNGKGKAGGAESPTVNDKGKGVPAKKSSEGDASNGKNSGGESHEGEKVERQQYPAGTKVGDAEHSNGD